MDVKDQENYNHYIRPEIVSGGAQVGFWNYIQNTH